MRQWFSDVILWQFIIIIKVTFAAEKHISQQHEKLSNHLK